MLEHQGFIDVVKYSDPCLRHMRRVQTNQDLREMSSADMKEVPSIFKIVKLLAGNDV